MSENVIISKRNMDGSVQVFRNLTEAAAVIGVTRQAISKAMQEKRDCAGRAWKKGFRIYVIKIYGEYQVCRKIGTGYKKLSGGETWARRLVDPEKIVEITAPIWGASM